MAIKDLSISNTIYINHAANSIDGILCVPRTYEQLLYEFEYIAWPRKLGTEETRAEPEKIMNQ